MHRPGTDEHASERTVEVVSGATRSPVTRNMLTSELAQFKACMYRALWIQGAGIVAVIGGIIGITEVIG